MAGAPEGNKNNEYSIEEMKQLCLLYAEHRRNGFDKGSFEECDHRTIEAHLEKYPIELLSEKKQIEKAERAGYKKWEQTGHDLASGRIQGNATAWIFQGKNKHGWKDKSEVTVNKTSRVTIINEDGTDYGFEDTDL